MILQKWAVVVKCLNPIRIREIESVLALNQEQAILVASKKASELLGEKGEGWEDLSVHIINVTYPRTKS
jgi:hypothetical protein